MQTVRNNFDDQKLHALIQRGDHSAFSIVFNKFYLDLLLYSGSFIADKSICEDIIQNVFMKFWSNASELHVKSSIKFYLLRMVRNHCIDYLRQQTRTRNHIHLYEASADLIDYEVENYILQSELETVIQNGLDEMKSEYRLVFEMSRFENKKYKEIADSIGVSVRTIEDRMRKALDHLREHLDKYLILLIAIYFSI